MARTHQRSIRIEQRFVPLLESLPTGTVNTLFNELLRVFMDEPVIHDAVKLTDTRFKDWKIPELLTEEVKPAKSPRFVATHIETTKVVKTAKRSSKPVDTHPHVTVHEVHVEEPASEFLKNSHEASQLAADRSVLPDETTVVEKSVDTVQKPDYSVLDDLPDF